MEILDPTAHYTMIFHLIVSMMMRVHTNELGQGYVLLNTNTKEIKRERGSTRETKE